MIVLDCNAAIAIMRETVEGEALRTLMLDGEEAVAPDLFCVELGSTLWQFVRAGHLDVSQIESAFRAGMNLVGEFYPNKDLVVEAVTESTRLNHSVYDMLYAVLARRQAATLFTLDKKLQTTCAKMGVNCVEEIAF